MKKASIFALGVGTLFFGVGISAMFLTPKEKIVLSIDDNHITWVDDSKKNEMGDSYYIYNDDFLVNKVKDNSYFLTKEKLIDEVGPDKIKKISINYNNEKILLNWDEANDVGTDNNIWIELYNKNEKLVSYSNKVNMNYISGVDKYILEIEKETFELYNEEFSIDRQYLKNGITMAKLYAIDKRGNKGIETTVPLYNYSIILNKENDKINFHIDDNTQDYKYKLYINDLEEGFISNVDELNSILIDTEAPNSISNVDLNITDKKLNATWQGVTDKGSIYNIMLEGYGLKYYNSAISDKVSFTKVSEVKGYYYAVNQKDNYMLTDKDSFTVLPSIDFEGKYGTYYLHVAAVDSVGNVSKTKTFKFDFIDKSLVLEESEDDKNSTNNNIGSNGENIDENVADTNNNTSDKQYLTIANELLVLKGNVSQSVYNKAFSLLRKINLDELIKMKNNNIKVYITTGEAEDLYESLIGTKLSENITGIFTWNVDNPFIIVESAYINSSLIHEIGHAIDYLYGGGDFVSKREDFMGIYELEKDKLIEKDDYLKSSSSEYFAEAYMKYYLNTYSLKVKAPKTYEYLKSIL